MAARKTLSCFSRWSFPSISSVFTEQWEIWLKNYQLVRELRRNPLHQVNWMNKKFLHNLLSQKCKPMKSDRETWCKNTSNDLRNCQKTGSSPDFAPIQVWDWSELDISSIFRHQEDKENQSVCRELRCLEIKEENRTEGRIQSNVRFVPVSDIKVCDQYGRYSIEVQVQSLFQDQTVSWIRIVNGIDKFVREAMPIQEEEKGSGKPAVKARPIWKPSSTSGWDFTLIEQRQWIDIETEESKEPYCFQVSKFITRLLRQSKSLSRRWWKKSNPKIQGFGQTRWRSNSSMLSMSIEKMVSVLARGGGQKERFQYWLNPNNPHRFLYFRAAQGHSGSTTNPTLQDHVLLPEGFTPCILITSETEKIKGQ